MVLQPRSCCRIASCRTTTDRCRRRARPERGDRAAADAAEGVSGYRQTGLPGATRRSPGRLGHKRQKWRCGLRLLEALVLELRDVDRRRGKLQVRNRKRGRWPSMRGDRPRSRGRDVPSLRDERPVGGIPRTRLPQPTYAADVGADNESVGAFRWSPLYLSRVRDVCATGRSSHLRSGSAKAHSLFAAKLNGVARTIATA